MFFGRAFNYFVYVSMQKYYYQLIIDQSLYSKLVEELDLQKSFRVLGVEEFAMEESEVDSLLGERSYSGGDLPNSVLDEVNDFQLNNKQNLIKIYFEEESEALRLCEKVETFFKQVIKVEKFESIDWNEEWKKSYAPIEISKQSILIPSWFETSDYKEFNNIIKIYPGMGFGTGSHETTYLCLKLFENNINLEQISTCMDYGCGSGILAIFVNILKNLDETHYYDIDPLALENTDENIKINQLTHTHKKLLPRDVEKFLDGYDLVFANILQNVLLAESDRIQKITKKYLVISGLLNGQEKEVIEKYHDFNLVRLERKNDWCALLMERK